MSKRLSYAELGIKAMSWSVSASGHVAEVAARLEEQFAGPLADKPAGISDDGERETVRLASELIAQCLSTFSAEKDVEVSAHGHMSVANWETREGVSQNVTITITPLA